MRYDPELLQIAQETYEPFPAGEDWREEVVIAHQQEIANRTAPGVADIPDEIIKAKIYNILLPISEKAKLEREHREAAIAQALKEREQLLQQVEVETRAEKYTDEDGWSIMYCHKVTIKRSGAVFRFKDRNLFDFGRVINPDYPVMGDPCGICLKQADGSLAWHQVGGKLCPLSEDESLAYEVISRYYGHCNSELRMEIDPEPEHLEPELLIDF